MASLERQHLRAEITQRREEGCAVGDLEARVASALGEDDEELLAALYDELDALQPAASFPYDEPSTLAEIRALRPPGPRRMAVELGAEDLFDRIYGAWLGRAAGCSLGKPVEGWKRSRIDDFLANAGALPLDDYVPFVDKAISPRLRSSTRDNIEFMARDDDMDYPILGLLALEDAGADFTPRKMANTWLSRMPYHLLYTAERNAYRNFVRGLWPPESAIHRNPFREWIGAQIRADIFGYVAPGAPELAAELAFRDASISHVKNGIYGEMFVAAMLAAAFVTDDVAEIVKVGLSEIPANCRLAEAVRETLGWCRTSADWEQVWERIDERYGHYHGVHTINNAALVVMGLYFGNRDFQDGIVVAVRGGWDTDCNGATVGSVLGLKFGAAALPGKWIGVLNDRLMSSVRDCNDNRISDLATRTHRVATELMTTPHSKPDQPAPPLAAVDGALQGEWRLQLAQAEWVLRVQRDLSGTVEDATSGDVSKLRNVETDGNKVRFRFPIDKGGWSVDVDFEGVVRGDRLVGNCFGDGFEMHATGVRQRP